MKSLFVRKLLPPSGGGLYGSSGMTEAKPRGHIDNVYSNAIREAWDDHND